MQAFISALDILWTLWRAWREGREDERRRERQDLEDERRDATIEQLKNEVKTFRFIRLLPCFKQFSIYFSMIKSDPGRNFDMSCLSYMMMTVCHARKICDTLQVGYRIYIHIPFPVPFNRTQVSAEIFLTATFRSMMPYRVEGDCFGRA